MTLGKRLKELRLEQNRTLEEVSSKLNFSRQTLQRYESGVISNIPSDKIEGLAKIYGVSPAYLMGWTDESDNSVSAVGESGEHYDATPKTVAAHFDVADLTDEEIEKVESFIKFVISERKKNG
jgi:transcriptional regulator with XRE-family HTH domain